MNNRVGKEFDLMRKKVKNMLAAFLSIALAATAYPVDIKAANVQKMSLSDISNVVGSFTVGTQVTAAEEGYYEFTVPSNGRLQIQEIKQDEYYQNEYNIYTGANKDCVGGLKDKYWIRVAAGIYYVYLEKDVTLQLNFVDEVSSNYEKEQNNSADTANEIQVNETYIGNNHISYASGDYLKCEYDDDDYYHFSLSEKGTVYINFSQICNSKDDGHILELYQEDSDRNLQLCSFDKIKINNGRSKKLRVPAGNYYLKICNYYDGFTLSCNVQDYSFQVCYTQEGETAESEPNDSKEQANVIQTNKEYTGNIASTSSGLDEDWYRLELLKDCNGQMKLTIPRQTENKMFTVELYSQLGILMESFTSTTNPVVYNADQAKRYQAGTYYIKVFGTDDDEDRIRSDSFIDYSLQFIDTFQQEDQTANTQTPDTVDQNTIFNIDDTDLVAYLPNEILTVGESEKIIFNNSLNCTYSISVSSDYDYDYDDKKQDVVYVDEMGVLHAVAPGTAIVTINTDIGKSAELRVTVKSASEPSYDDSTSDNHTDTSVPENSNNNNDIDTSTNNKPDTDHTQSNHNSDQFQLPRNYKIFASRKKYNASNYTKKIKFKGKTMTVKGNFYISNLQDKPLAMGYSLSIKISPKCKYYYGENKITFKKLKKLIKKGGNNCPISFGVTVKNKKAVKIGLYA